MNNRTVIRSLVTNEGSIVAMDEGTIAWRPCIGTRTQTKLEALTTVLLAVKGPNERYDSVVVGDSSGGISVLSLPRLEKIDKFVVDGGIVRSVHAVSPNGHKFMAATQDGSVWIVGSEVPGRCVKLFKHSGPVTSLRIDGESIHIQSGWNRQTYDWCGEMKERYDGNEKFLIKQRERNNRRARILQSEQIRKEQSQPLMLDLPALG